MTSAGNPDMQTVEPEKYLGKYLKHTGKSAENKG
jgi:hypothetical protein